MEPTPLNEDFRDLLKSFAAAEVRFVVVGAYALAVHGIPRATGDIDLWADAWSRRIESRFGETTFGVLGRDDLLVNKRAAGRPKDLLDAALLEKLPR